MIVSKTILFIVIVSAIILFKTVFGDGNVLIGITTITRALLLLERDLTVHPLKNTLKLVGLKLAIGVCSYMDDTNIRVGVIVNLILIFAMGYSLLYYMK